MHEANNVHKGYETNSEYHGHDTSMPVTNDAMSYDDGCDVYEEGLEGLDDVSEVEDESAVFHLEE